MEKMIIKRDGTVEPFNPEKIFKAIKKAFISTARTVKDEEIQDLVSKILDIISKDTLSVEEVQDLVEQTLMNDKYFDVARHYILYREVRNKKRQYRNEINNIVPSFDLNKVLKDIQRDFTDDCYDLSKLLSKYKSFKIFQMDEVEKLHTLIRASIELINVDEPSWDLISGRLFMYNFNLEVKENLKTHNLTSFQDRLNLYVKRFGYDNDLLKYSEEELKILEKYINKNRDKLLTYSQIKIFLQDYLARLKDFDFIETIQEFYMIISMIKNKNSASKLEDSKRYYDSLSKQEINLTNSDLFLILKSLAL